MKVRSHLERGAAILERRHPARLAVSCAPALAHNWALILLMLYCSNVVPYLMFVKASESTA
jgi:hypothetical protein